MKAVGWTILVVVAVLVAIIALTVIQQFDLLQVRVHQGIGTSTQADKFVPETP